MLLRALITFIVLFFVAELQSCCLPPHNELQHSAERYYYASKASISREPIIINDISIVNIRKYNCDSIAAYVRVKGVLKKSSRHTGYDFDVARRLTIVKKGGTFQVVHEQIEK